MLAYVVNWFRRKQAKKWKGHSSGQYYRAIFGIANRTILLKVNKLCEFLWMCFSVTSRMCFQRATCSRGNNSSRLKTPRLFYVKDRIQGWVILQPSLMRFWQRTREVRWQRLRTLPAPRKGRTSAERRRCSSTGHKSKCQVGHIPCSFQGQIEPSFFLLALCRNPHLQRDPQTAGSGTKRKNSAGNALMCWSMC
jgi:hypothetical protein